MIKKIYVFGASITQSTWWTWKDFLEIESQLPVESLALKGVGNNYMINSVIDQPIDEDSLIVGMFTTVDKFDWYVEGDRFRSLQSEKHQPIPVSDDSGFWCTGSWFPREKSIFQQDFYSLDYFCAQTIRDILTLKQVCEMKRTKLEFFFDSPIWEYTEQDLISMLVSGQGKNPRNLLDLPLAKKWRKFLDSRDLELSTNSLIGYCWKNDLPWANEFYQVHPPSSSHWKFYNEIMRPRILQHLPLSDSRLDQKLKAMDDGWAST